METGLQPKLDKLYIMIIQKLKQIINKNNYILRGLWRINKLPILTWLGDNHLINDKLGYSN
jgi:hypothetical protein